MTAKGNAPTTQVRIAEAHLSVRLRPYLRYLNLSRHSGGHRCLHEKSLRPEKRASTSTLSMKQIAVPVRPPLRFRAPTGYASRVRGGLRQSPSAPTFAISVNRGRGPQPVPSHDRPRRRRPSQIWQSTVLWSRMRSALRSSTRKSNETDGSASQISAVQRPPLRRSYELWEGSPSWPRWSAAASAAAEPYETGASLGNLPQLRGRDPTSTQEVFRCRFANRLIPSPTPIKIEANAALSTLAPKLCPVAVPTAKPIITSPAYRRQVGCRSTNWFALCQT